MRHITFTDIQPRPTVQDVADVEQRLGVAFPAPYRKWLLDHNGGNFAHAKLNYRLEEFEFRDWITRMYAVNSSDWAKVTDLVRQNEAIRSFEPRYIPADAIAIGGAGQQGMVILYCRGDRVGQVWYLADPGDFPEELIEPGAGTANCFLAKTFDEFWNVVDECPEEQIP